MSDELRQAAEQVQEELKRTAAGVKWVEPKNLHVTLKFLGETHESQVPAITDVMRRAAMSQPPFRIVVRGAGAFPSARRPRVIWLGVSEGFESLSAIAERIEDGLAKLGFEREERPFRAHITIGRLRTPRRIEPLTAELDLMGARECGGMTCESIVLMRSELSRSGPTYTALETVTLSC